MPACGERSAPRRDLRGAARCRYWDNGIGLNFEATLTAALLAGGRATGFWMDGDAATAASRLDWPGAIETQPWWNTSAEILQRVEAVWKNMTLSTRSDLLS